MLVSLVGCGGKGQPPGPPRLYSPVNGQIGFGRSGLTPGKQFSWGAIPLCLDRPGQVTVTSVEAVDAVNGLQVVAFAVRPYRNNAQGNADGDLAALGFSPADIVGRTITQVCDQGSRANVGLPTALPSGASAGQSELAITVVGTSERRATATSLRIGYTSSGQHFTTTAAVALALCPGTPDARCDPPL